ncbi:tyrosine-type recombinase/integrase [Pectinatus haikarae]|uniref:tyrosine-type recombinase/integrase n=1 Tax=Pectinatus haikarae TaxID=349096 RepID=UPI0018C66306|nr:tyrosine-type recombinase/integrase [Pectinatus haikarae]
MYPTTPSQWFSKFLKRKGLPHMPFHALRHLSATLLISLGIPLKNISSRLGHADIRTTANIYGEALQSVDRQAADQLDQYFRKTINKQA